MRSGFVRNSAVLWQTYQTAKQFQVRPSELLGISDPWTAYCLDNAVALFGSTLENELDGVTGKNSKDVARKRERMLTKWLDLPQRYRSPMAATRRKQSDGEQDTTVQGDMF